MIKETFIFGLILCVFVSSTSTKYTFPSDFEFGVATSSYQIEGGWDADGKGLSVWDKLTHTPGFIQDGSTGDVACDSYHNWERDVEMVKETGVNFYRFSLSWTRIYPQGFINYENPAGVAYYNNLIDKLLENGIQPVVTLYHWDLPQMFSVLGSWPNDELVNYYAHYARRAFELFGDRVKTWITFNEPKLVCQDFNGFIGSFTVPYPSGVIEYLCTYNLIKAHAAAYRLYQNEFKLKQRGRVSITLNFEWYEPASDSKADKEAAEQRRQFEFGLYANPILNWDFPQIVKDRVAERSRLEGYPESRLPEFSLADKLTISGSYDFLGVNHYNSWLVQAAPDAPIAQASYEKDTGAYRFQPENWVPTISEWNKVTPWGLKNLLIWIKDTYRNPIVLITECGYPDATGAVEDQPRIDFLKGYMNATLEAIHQHGSNVKAFTVWSLMDNFEWVAGYTIKFGIFNVDFNDPNRTRTAKDSVAWLRNVVKTRSLD